MAARKKSASRRKTSSTSAKKKPARKKKKPAQGARKKKASGTRKKKTGSATRKKKTAGARKKKASGARKKATAARGGARSRKGGATAGAARKQKSAGARKKQTAPGGTRTKKGAARARAKPRTREPERSAPAARVSPTGELSAREIVEAIPVPVGRVSAWYAEPEAMVVDLDADLRCGDTIYVRGPTSDFFERIGSLRVDGADREEARAGERVGVRVSRRARPGDHVYRVSA